jgi:hypothetical protein
VHSLPTANSNKVLHPLTIWNDSVLQTAGTTEHTRSLYQYTTQHSHQQQQSPAKYIKRYQLVVFPRLKTLKNHDYFWKCDAVVSGTMPRPYSMSKSFILTTSSRTAHFSETSVDFYTTPHSIRWQNSCEDSFHHNEYAHFLTTRTCSLPQLTFCQFLLSVPSGGNTENCTLLDYYSASSGSFSPTFRDNLSVSSAEFKNRKDITKNVVGC